MLLGGRIVIFIHYQQCSIIDSENKATIPVSCNFVYLRSTLIESFELEDMDELMVLNLNK